MQLPVTSNDLYTYGPAIALALLLHVGVVVLLAANWGEVEIDRIDIQPYYIEASIVAENPYTAEEEKRAEKEKSARKQRIQKRRLTEQKLLEEQAAWEKAQAEKRRREAEAASRPAPVEQEASREAPGESEATDPGFADELTMLLEREANARKAVTDDEKALAYVGQIQREIIQNWSRPPSARNGMEALLRVRLIPTGEVVDVKLEEGSGNDAFDRSAILAVRKADRFVVPRDAMLFERNFREFTVLFRPDDLRL